MKMRARYVSLMAFLSVPALAIAAPVTISISDLLEGNPVATVMGFDPATLNTHADSESFDLHGEYVSALNLANGTTITVNFNFMEPLFEEPTGVALISDTLNVVFTGHTPTANDTSNISVDLHFRSDSDPLGVTPLTGAISLAETGALQNLTSDITRGGGPADFNISVASDVVPEPGTVTLLLIGAGGILIGGMLRRRR